MARPTRRRGKAPPPPVSQREKEVDLDVFEAEDSDPEEDRLQNKYDNVENYEYELPSDFEDEEIDEDTAFTAEDEEMFGHLFADRGLQAGSGSEEEGDSDGEGSDPDLLLRSESEAEDEAEASDDEFEGMFGSASEVEDDDEDGVEGSAHDDENGSHAALLAAVTGGLRKRAAARAAAVTEAYPESEHGLASAEGLSVSDLLAGLGTSQAALGGARKALARMEAKQRAVAPPLPGPIQARLERQAGYERAQKDVTKWQPLVEANRAAPTVRFVGERGPSQEGASLPALVAAHAPATAMEAEVAALLAAAGAHSTQALAEAEGRLVARSVDAEDARARRDRLAKMRALLYYHEAKAKRLKRIKSKEYRRQLRRAETRQARKLGLLGEGEVGDARLDRERAELARAQERLTLKHKNTSKWARRALRRGLAHQDEDTRAAIAEQLRRGQELTDRPRTGERGSDDEEDDQSSDAGGSTSASEDEDEEGAPTARERTRAAALELLRGAGDEEAPASGLLALPFMKRQLERRRQAAVQEAKSTLGEDGDAAGGKRADSERVAAARLSFAGKAAPRAAIRARKAPREDAGSDSELSGMESDERETVEEKRARLARSLAEEREERAAQAQAASDRVAAAQRAGASDKAPDVSTSSSAPSALRSKAHASDGFVAVPAAAKPQAAARKEGKAAGPAQIKPTPQPAFTAAKKFAGAKPGYVFKKGPQGVGYYLDKPAQGAKAQNGSAPAPVGKKAQDKKANGAAPAKGATAAQKRKSGQEAAAVPAAASKKAKASAPEKAAAGGKSAAPGKQNQLLTQDDLVRMAFAGDDVVAEFAEEKRAEVEGELPAEEAVGVLPGWGAWSGAQREPAWMAEARQKSAERRAAAAAARKDASLQFVVLSEKWDKKAAKYRTSAVPYPYDSKETYERARRQPLGPEFNTDEAFRDLTRPAVLKDSGVVIQPLRFTDGLAKVARALPKRAQRNPVNTIQAGTLQSKARAK